MTKTLNVKKLEAVAFILKTIAHPTRLAIIDLLKNQPQLSVSEICTQLSAEQSLISHHLSNMKLKGILGSDRQGRNIYYYLKLQEVLGVIDCMETCEALDF